MRVILIVLALALAAGTLLVANVGGRALRRAIRFASFARRGLRPISSLVEGPVRLQGFAELPSANREVVLLTSPLSNHPSLWFELAISSQGSELTLVRKSIPTLLKDGSGELELDLGSAELELDESPTWRGTLASELPPGIDAALRARIVGAAAEAETRSGTRRDAVILELRERAVKMGQPLHVCGTVVRTGSGSSLVSSRPVIVASRPFSEIASRDALVALVCTTLALAGAGAFAAVLRALLEAKRGSA